MPARAAGRQDATLEDILDSPELFDEIVGDAARSAFCPACVSKHLRAAVVETWVRRARDCGKLDEELKLGEEVNRDVLNGRSNFAWGETYFLTELYEDHYDPGASGTLGAFEGAVAAYFLVNGAHYPNPKDIQVRSEGWHFRGERHGEPLFSISIPTADEAQGLSHTVLPKAGFARVTVGADGQLGEADWEHERQAILSPPAEWAGFFRASPDSGVIQEITRDELHALWPSHPSADCTYLVGIHFAVASEFMLWDHDCGPEGPLATPAELTTRAAGHTLQVWRGNKQIESVQREDLEDLLVHNHYSFDTRAARLTVQKIVDSEPRDAAAARRDAATERAVAAQRGTAAAPMRVSDIRAAFAQHGLEAPSKHKYPTGGAKACDGRSAAQLAAEEARLKYLREHVPTLRAEVQRLEDHVLWLKDRCLKRCDLCGRRVHSREDVELQLAASAFAAEQLPDAWPWLAK
jgi:hypothetical protein